MNSALLVRLSGTFFEFRAGETILTENSYKYTVAGFHALAGSGVWEPIMTWTDKNNLFSVHALA